ncbi:glycosyltransferase family 2 protein, partial [Corallococcus praedator]
GKVLFCPQFVMPTSGRRMQKQGFLKMASIYFINYFSILFSGKPITKGYKDIR